jgi:uncharacterized protein
MAEDFAVSVVYACPGGGAELRTRAAPGATLSEVVRASGILQRFPEIDLSAAKIGVWGKLRDPSSAVHAGDRIEIYRPLIADPKATRSLRAANKKRAAAPPPK